MQLEIGGGVWVTGFKERGTSGWCVVCGFYFLGSNESYERQGF